MGRGGRGGGAGLLGRCAKTTLPPPHPPLPPPTVYKQFINNPCTRMLSTRMLNAKFSIALYSACMRVCAYALALRSLEITMDCNIYHIPESLTILLNIMKTRAFRYVHDSRPHSAPFCNSNSSISIDNLQYYSSNNG